MKKTGGGGGRILIGEEGDLGEEREAEMLEEKEGDCIVQFFCF